MKSKLILGLAVLAFAFTPAAKKLNLQFKLEKGKTYVQTIALTSTTKQTYKGTEQVVDQAVSAKTSMELKESGENSDTYTVWYNNINLGVTQAGQEQKFNSDTTQLSTVDPMSALFSHIVNNKFQATFDRKGKVQNISGLEEIITNATSGLGPQGAAVAPQLSASFGDNGLTKNMEMITAIIPDEPVKVGSTWTNEQFTSSGLPLLLNNTYTLKKVNDGIATIDVAGILSVDPNNATADLQGMDATYFMDGTRSGTIQMEVATGWVKSAQFTDSIAGSITIAANDKMPDGATIPIEMNTKTTVSSN